MRCVSPILAFVLAAGCDYPPAVRPPRPLTVRAPDRVWANAPFVLVSEAFAYETEFVMIDGDTVAAARVNETTLTLVAPPVAGSVRLEVGAEGRLPWRGEIAVDGYLDRFSGPAFDGHASPVPGDEPEVFAFAVTRAVRVNLGTGTVQRLFPDSAERPACPMLGPVLSLNGTDVAAVAAGCRIRFHAAGAATPTDSSCASLYGTRRSAVYLGSRRALLSGADWTYLCTLSPDGSEAQSSREYYTDWVAWWVLSPRRDRIVPVGGGTWFDQGIWVRDSTGAVAYRIYELVDNWAAGFTADGDTLYVLGDRRDQGTLLVAVHAATGGTLDTVRFSAAVERMLVDPDRPYIYLLVAGPSIRVLDRRTLQSVATVPAGPPVQWPRGYNDALSELVLNRRASELLIVVHSYAVSQPADTVPSIVTRLTLPPR
jgi:hypothetical protein